MEQAKIDALKAQYGEIFSYKANGKVCYLRKPDIDDIDYAQSVSKSTMGFKRALVNNIWLSGDEELRASVKYALGLFGMVSELIEIEVGEFSKL
jgi:hypothetical protein